MLKRKHRQCNAEAVQRMLPMTSTSVCIYLFRCSVDMCEFVYLYRYVFVYMSMLCLHLRAEALHHHTCLNPSRVPRPLLNWRTRPCNASGGVRGGRSEDCTAIAIRVGIPRPRINGPRPLSGSAEGKAPRACAHVHALATSPYHYNGRPIECLIY